MKQRILKTVNPDVYLSLKKLLVRGNLDLNPKILRLLTRYEKRGFLKIDLKNRKIRKIKDFKIFMDNNTRIF